jgi:subtilisin family serine protease
MHSKKQICTPIVRWRLYHISRKSGIDFNNILDGVFVMIDQKRENLLNLALAATEVERRRVPELSAGYNSYSKTWEVIVQYQGDLAFLEGQGVRVTLLLFSYAILLVPESLMDYVTGLPQITYLEKPKLLYFADAFVRSISCITPVQEGVMGLSGNGVLLACIDSGVDYAHPDFCAPDGTSRIAILWDQTIPGNPPMGYALGSVYTRQQINEALASSTPEERFALVPSRDVTGHGTAVLGIAAGNGRSSADAAMQGVAPEATLVVVKLGNPDPADLPRTSQLLQAVDFCVRYALLVERPLVINLSFGNNYGSHSGDSLLETYLNAVSNLGQNVICIGAGNEGDTGRHYAGNLKSDRKSSGQTQTVRATSDPAATSAVSATADRAVSVEFQVGAYESSFSLQIWKVYGDEISIELISPGGIRSGTLSPVLGTARLTLGSTELLLFYGMPSPYSQAQEIYLTFQGTGSHLSVENGIWTLRLTPGRLISGSFDLWLPGGNAIGPQTRFFSPATDTTLTIPSTARSAITVGAYDPRLSSYASFSGRGYTRILHEIKPDLAAPGVNIPAPRSGGGYASFTGTSFATPFVSGSAALMMEWGILRGNDPFLYGEKLKAYLIAGTKPIASESEYPNRRGGWGRLCLESSLPD